jgi:hypothetical protein
MNAEPERFRLRSMSTAAPWSAVVASRIERPALVSRPLVRWSMIAGGAAGEPLIYQILGVLIPVDRLE